MLREIGLWWSDLVIWPAILAAAGASLLWRQSRSIAGEEAAPAPTTGEVLRSEPGVPPRRDEAERRENLRSLYRGGFGVALIAGAALIVLSASGALSGAKDAVIVAVIVILALALFLAPFWWRLGRNLAAERASGSARRSAPRWPPTSTTPSCRR